MKTLIALLVTCFLLAGCTPETKKSDKFDLPPGLKDCSVYRMQGSNANVIYAVVCPGRQVTTTTTGKVSHTFYADSSEG